MFSSRNFFYYITGETEWKVIECTFCLFFRAFVFPSPLVATRADFYGLIPCLNRGHWFAPSFFLFSSYAHSYARNHAHIIRNFTRNLSYMRVRMCRAHAPRKIITLYFFHLRIYHNKTQLHFLIGCRRLRRATGSFGKFTRRHTIVRNTDFSAVDKKAEPRRLCLIRLFCVAACCGGYYSSPPSASSPYAASGTSAASATTFVSGVAAVAAAVATAGSAAGSAPFAALCAASA